ncbi:hypothetical protein [Prosthecobacter sp.]|uniref:hypothetical protein n=1 Tax=Prosthecobacter sp. TaxID=1965333 RepID=UPI0037849AA1
MKRALCLLAGLLTLSLLPASAAEKTFPAKNPVLKFELPEKWTSEVDASDGSISLTSDDKDERISVNFVEVKVEATMEDFKGMVPEMVKELKNAQLVQEAKEQTSDGLTGYTTGYIGTYEGNQAMMIIILFKAGEGRSIIETAVMMEPATMPKEQAAKFDALMNSVKGIKEK